MHCLLTIRCLVCYNVVCACLEKSVDGTDSIPLSGFFLELPTSIEDGRCLFGAEDGGFKEGSLAERDEAFIYQSSSSECVFGGAVSGHGSGKQTKPDTIGWADLSDNEGGLAAGVRWFWQLHPKSIELTRSGLVRVCLYPQHGMAQSATNILSKSKKMLRYNGYDTNKSRTCRRIAVWMTRVLH